MSHIKATQVPWWTRKDGRDVSEQFQDRFRTQILTEILWPKRKEAARDIFTFAHGVCSSAPPALLHSGQAFSSESACDSLCSLH
jgi:hypothetical protein